MARSAPLAIALSSPPLSAEPEAAALPAPAPPPKPAPAYGLTGDWGGLRTRLADDGVTLYGSALAEVASDVSGGKRRHTSVATQANAGAAFDMDRLAGWKGATVRVEFAYRDGENLSATGVGNLFEVQETYGGGRIARLAELSVDQALAGGKLDLKVGRVFAGADFAFSPLFCAFQNNAICGHPNSIPYNTGISLYPVASWGMRVEVKPVHGLDVRTGVFEVNPSLNDKNGFDWSTNGATGAFVPVEIGVSINLDGGRPGLLRVGGYYDSSNTPDSYLDVARHSRALSGLAPLQRPGRWGVYALAEQAVWAGSNGRSLTAFAGATRSDRATAYFDYFLEGGLVRKGTFHGRDHDTIALGVAYGHVSPARAAYERDAGTPIETEETIIEANYGIQLRPWLSLRPNLQYVVRPGGTGRLPDATVVGLQTAITL